jgi:hypothetical protein
MAQVIDMNEAGFADAFPAFGEHQDTGDREYRVLGGSFLLFPDIYIAGFYIRVFLKNFDDFRLQRSADSAIRSGKIGKEHPAFPYVIFKFFKTADFFHVNLADNIYKKIYIIKIPMAVLGAGIRD